MPVPARTRVGWHPWRYAPSLISAFPLSIIGNRPDAPPSEDLPPTDAPAAPSGTGKYVPPSMRSGAVRGGESMNRPRDDLPTLRVTNVSEEANEDDLRDLFSRFGRLHRVYIGRDRETGMGKGYAFVSFEDRDVAEKAMHKIHGMGTYFVAFSPLYAHLQTGS